jgi:hypothetical protein
MLPLPVDRSCGVERIGFRSSYPVVVCVLVSHAFEATEIYSPISTCSKAKGMALDGDEKAQRYMTTLLRWHSRTPCL